MDAPPTHLRAVPAGPAAAAAAAADLETEVEASGFDGVTAPTTGGTTGRFLTDVIVELGFVDREKVEAAVEAARVAGRPPEHLLVENGSLSRDQFARATAERFPLHRGRARSARAGRVGVLAGIPERRCCRRGWSGRPRT